MSETQRMCSHCGAPMDPEAPRGLCPECLLKAGLPSETESGLLDPIPADSPPSPEELAGQFPDLEILELLGRGGMGVVYKARQKRLDRLVALKILASALEKAPGFAERFAREAKALARFSHPHIVGVFDFGQTEAGRYYLLMEYVDGANLRDVIRTGHVSAAEALAIVPQICAALEFAHAAGIVHRDIKPENILLDQAGRVKIADFGLAKMLQRPGDAYALTQAGTRMGTVRYMAPEQLDRPELVDHRADIYSLGVVFYELLTGEIPMGRFQPPSRRAHIDVRLDEVVLRSLEREPERRYQHASDMKTDVEAIAHHTPPPAAEPPQTPPPPPRRHSRPPPSTDQDSIRKAVRAPALGLVAVGALNMLPAFFLILYLAALTRPGNGVAVFLESAVYGLIGAACILAGRHMRRLQSLDLAFAGCLLALIPFAPYRVVQPFSAMISILGLTVGLWGLAVLSRSEVREAFIPPHRPENKKRLWIMGAATLIAILTARDFGLRVPWMFFATVGAVAAWNLTSNHRADVAGRSGSPNA